MKEFILKNFQNFNNFNNFNMNIGYYNQNSLIIDEDYIKNIKNPLNNIFLKKHQKLLLSYMEEIEKTKKIKLENNSILQTNYGFICDIVGSGKSIVILALILNNFKVLNNKENYLLRSYTMSINQSPNSLYTETFKNRNIKNRETIYNLSMIVVPHSIIDQWTSYLKDYTINIKYEIIKNKNDLSKVNHNILKDIQILLVSSTKFNLVADKFQSCTISRLIIDEIDSITIPKCSCKIDAVFSWFISSSIYCIRVGYYKHHGLISNILKYNYYRTNEYIILKNDEEFIKESMALDEPIFNEIYCYQKILAGKILHGLIDDRILNMINANAINQVSSILNIQKCDNSNIVNIVSNNLTIDINNKQLELQTLERMIIPNLKNKMNMIQNKKKEIKEIENKKILIEKRLKDNNVDPITLEEIKNVTITKCCQNKFEMESILKCQKCPMCRSIITNDNLIIVNNNNNDNKKKENIELDKYETFQKLIEKNILPNEKILIFSEYNESFLKIQKILEEKKKKFKIIKGTSTTINNIIDNYNNKDLNILFLNAQYYGTGLNLIHTDHIILFHKMNVDLENQVVGRAQRIGRNKKLIVWKLLHFNE